MMKNWLCNPYIQSIYETDAPYGFKTKNEAIEDAMNDLFKENLEVEKIIKRNNDHIKALRKLIETK